MQSIERDGIRFRGLGEILELTVLDYHVGAVHLSNEELASLGFRVEDPERADPSVVLAARAQERHGGDAPAALRGPRPRGLSIGGLYLAAVREGLDVFVDEFETHTSGLTRSVLRRVGIIPLQLELPYAPAGDPGACDPSLLSRAFAEIEVAANTTGIGDGEAALVIEAVLPDVRVRFLPFRQFRAQFCDAPARVAAEAGQAEAIERASIQLCVIDHRVGEIGHFLLRRPTAVPRATLPEVAVRLACLAHAERCELIARRRRALNEASALVRILPWSAICPSCREPAMRAFEYETDDSDRLGVQRCHECGLEMAIATPPLVGLTAEEIARFAPAELMDKLFPATRSARAGEP